MRAEPPHQAVGFNLHSLIRMHSKVSHPQTHMRFDRADTLLGQTNACSTGS
ncbi:hypothetical protein RISK_004791 [Rhodopirellula islandica]|uniref:Uncharacterized protein n=1 Tax=Rhodopirellula islandica TaxID=595434 RepID=A0A0J1B8W5_RHOIS|nr:hypothetical protein RISK_004791 [Rhodopirellula islandica]